MPVVSVVVGVVSVVAVVGADVVVGCVVVVGVGFCGAGATGWVCWVLWAVLVSWLSHAHPSAG